MHAAAVALGGALGAWLRWIVGGAVQRSGWASPAFPSGTLVVNVTGCFVLGLLATLFQERFLLDPVGRTFLLVGVLGGYTTFSTFAFETFALIEEGSVGLALVNGIGAPVLGLAAAVAGVFVGRVL